MKLGEKSDCLTLWNLEQMKKGYRENMWKTEKSLTKSGSQHSEGPHSSTLLETQGLGCNGLFKTIQTLRDSAEI